MNINRNLFHRCVGYLDATPSLTHSDWLAEGRNHCLTVSTSFRMSRHQYPKYCHASEGPSDFGALVSWINTHSSCTSRSGEKVKPIPNKFVAPLNLTHKKFGDFFKNPWDQVNQFFKLFSRTHQGTSKLRSPTLKTRLTCSLRTLEKV